MNNSLTIFVNKRKAGWLKKDQNAYVFSYDPHYLAESDPIPVSLTLPLTVSPYRFLKFPSFFDGLLPEGALRKQYWRHYGLVDHDAFGLLSVCGKDRVGNVTISADDTDVDWLNQASVIPLDISDQKRWIDFNVQQGITVAGYQPKYIAIDPSDQSKISMVKPFVQDYPNMTIMESVVMDMAQASGIETAPHGLIDYGNKVAYVTHRMDRICKEGKTTALAMEDFAQLSKKDATHKYIGSYEQCAKLIMRYSCEANKDLYRFYRLIVFCFLTGNSDMHLKNFSRLQCADSPHAYRLAPAYDLLSVNVVEPKDSEECALTINGKKRNLRRSDFLKLAKVCKLDPTTVEQIVNRFANDYSRWNEIINDSTLVSSDQHALLDLIRQRLNRFDR